MSYGSAGGRRQAHHGGSGGGILHLTVEDTIHVDGTLASDGSSPEVDNSGSGGGSGGSIWIHTHRINGYGMISSAGGDGSKNGDASGGGGGGGRIAVYFVVNETMPNFSYRVKGGAGGNPVYTGSQPVAESGGSGTAVLYHMVHEHRTLLVDNGGLRVNIV